MFVGLERLPVHDPDRGQLPGPFGVQRASRLFLHDRVHLLEEGEVVGVDAVERGFGEADEPGRRRIVRGRQRVDPGGHQRVEPVQGADHDPVRVRRGPEHEVPLRFVAGVVRRQE